MNSNSCVYKFTSTFGLTFNKSWLYQLFKCRYSLFRSLAQLSFGQFDLYELGERSRGGGYHVGPKLDQITLADPPGLADLLLPLITAEVRTKTL